MEYMKKEKFDELTEAIKARRLLLANHAKTPLTSYSLEQKILIQGDRDHAVQFLTDKINRLMQEGAENESSEKLHG